MQAVAAHLGVAQGGVVRRVEQHIAVHRDRARVGRFEEVQAAQEGGFARAGRADDGQRLPALEGKADALEDFGAAEALGDVVDFKNCHVVFPSLYAEIIELAFEPAEQQGQYADKDQEEDGGGEQRPDQTLGGELLAHHDDLLGGDDVCQRRVLDQRHEFVAHRRENALDDLQKRDLEEDLRFGHAEHLTGLVLAARDGLDAAAENLGKIAGIIDDEGHTGGGEAGQKVPAPQQTRTVKNNDDLEHQRRAANDPDEGLDQPRKRLKAAHRAERDDQSERQTEQQRDEKDGAVEPKTA